MNSVSHFYCIIWIQNLRNGYLIFVCMEGVNNLICTAMCSIYFA